MKKPNRDARTEGSDGAELTRRIGLRGQPLLLDGATGTELERAGLPTGLPLWSTHALIERPESVHEIHLRYAQAGAEILTANTFRTQRRTLERAGQPPESDRRLTRLAIELARDAAASSTGPMTPWIAGSLPPLEDCYAPERVPNDDSLEREHTRQAGLLAEAGADLILAETMNTIREATAATRAAIATGLPVLVSFVSWRAGLLLSGEPLAEAAAIAIDLGASAVGVNCLPPSSLRSCQQCLSPTGLPLLVSPNLGEPNDQDGFSRDEDAPPEALTMALSDWIAESELRVIGGCCGTTPAHITALARALP
jgi:S-methylmethionine-dependent homocysteine/selenocysteine methylase